MQHLFWVMAVGLAHRIPEKEMIKCFVSGLKSEVYKEKMFSRSCDTLVEVTEAARTNLTTYGDILEILGRIKSWKLKRTSSNVLIVSHLRQIFLSKIFSSLVQVPLYPPILANLAKISKKNIQKKWSALNAKKCIAPISAQKSRQKKQQESSKSKRWKIKEKQNLMKKWFDKL